MSATLEPLGYAPLTPDEIDQALDMIGVRPRSTAELVRRLSSTPAAIRAALEPLIPTGHLIRPPGGDWRPGERFGAAADPRPAPPSRLPELEAPPPETGPSLQARILALVRAEPGIAQAEVGRRIGDQASASRVCKYAETLGQIRREKIPGSIALRLFPAPALEPAPVQAAAPEPTPAAPDRVWWFGDAALLPPGEDLGGDCDGVADELAALSGYVAQLQRLQTERAAAFATLGQPAGHDLPAAILAALESARRGLPLADAGETARLRARVAELEADADERIRDHFSEIDAIWKEIGGGPGGTPAEAIRLRVAELERQRDAARAERRTYAEAIGWICGRLGIAIPEDLARITETIRRLQEDLDGKEREIERLEGSAADLKWLQEKILCETPGTAAGCAWREIVSLRERTEKADAPRWVETAPGSWDLQVLRPVAIATVDRASATGFEWELADGSESGATISLERAQRRVEDAIEDASRG